MAWYKWLINLDGQPCLTSYYLFQSGLQNLAMARIKSYIIFVFKSFSPHHKHSIYIYDLLSHATMSIRIHIPSYEWKTAIYYPGQTIDVIVYLEGSSRHKPYRIRMDRYIVRYPLAGTPSVIIRSSARPNCSCTADRFSGRSRDIMGPYKIMGVMNRIILHQTLQTRGGRS